MSLSDFEGYEEGIRQKLATAVDTLSREFEGTHDRQTVTDVVEDSARQVSGGAVTPFIPVLAERFARERLQARAQIANVELRTVAEVLFVGITGGGRAQMGAELMQRRVADAAKVHSAGHGSAGAIDPNVQVVMQELGIDLSEGFTRPLTPEIIGSVDIVVTMGRSVGEVAIPAGVRHVDWRVGDPSGADVDEVRRVRDDIERRVAKLADELLAEAAAKAEAAR
jgi:arsenate reductase (thioredoxin)